MQLFQKDDTPRGKSSAPQAAFSSSTPGRESPLSSPKDLPASRTKSRGSILGGGKRGSVTAPAQAEKRALDDAELKRLEECFSKFDKDDSGSITYKELIPFLKDYGCEVPRDVAAIDYVLAYDENPDGRLDRDEILCLVTDLINKCVRTKPLQRVDQSLEDTIHHLAEGSGMAALDPLILFRTADADGGGAIDFAEFERLHQIIVKETENSAKQIFQAETEANLQKQAAKHAQKKVKQLMAAVVALFCLLGLALASIFAISILGGVLINESHSAGG
jgi:Ca2+-binding EF-hand superfamily protein